VVSVDGSIAPEWLALLIADGASQPQVGWDVVVLTQIIHPLTTRMTRTALPLSTVWNSVE